MFDLDDINEHQYKNFIKFMEIRNQFIHDFDCNSFLTLSATIPEYTKFLLKHFPNSNSNLNEESKLNESYEALFQLCLDDLKLILKEYKTGALNELITIINSEVLDDIDNILDQAVRKWRNHQRPKNPLELPFNFSENRRETERLVDEIKLGILDKGVEISQLKSNSKEAKSVFSRRISESKAKLKKIKK